MMMMHKFVKREAIPRFVRQTQENVAKTELQLTIARHTAMNIGEILLLSLRNCLYHLENVNYPSLNVQWNATHLYKINGNLLLKPIAFLKQILDMI